MTTKHDMGGALKERIYLSPPQLTGAERRRINEALDSGWIAPLGPQVDAFEAEFARGVGAPHAVALSSGTAALHIALLVAGVTPGSDVLVPTMTFVATVNPIRYVGANPVLIDSEAESWNISPSLLEAAIRDRIRLGSPPTAVVVVHLYGQTANMTPILAVCREHGIPVIEDAAEALGASCEGRAAGAMGDVGVFSFNGNKIITTSGGGMLVSGNAGWASRARHLATQAREPAPHYQHTEVGFNYRLSNVLAAVGRAQLDVLGDRVRQRRQVFDEYTRALADTSGVALQPEAPWSLHSRWLTCVRIDPDEFGADREAVRLALERENIEARPLWKPMHLQPLYRDAEKVGGDVAERLFRDGLCLPSGPNLDRATVDRIVGVIRGVAR